MVRRDCVRGRLLAVGLFALGAAAPALAQSGPVYYTYDALGRAISAWYPDGTCLAYAYDAAGNRTIYTSSTIGSPVANPVSAGTWQDVASTFDPRVNDSVCGTLTVSAVGAPSHGTTSIVSGGTGVTYTPALGYTGADSFTYQVSNGHTVSGNGTITMTVRAPTLPPVARGGSALFAGLAPVQPGTTTDVSSLISDPYGYALTVSGVTNGANGTVSYLGTTITYIYKAVVVGQKTLSDSYTYTVSDGHGHTATATVVVSMYVTTNL